MSEGGEAGRPIRPLILSGGAGTRLWPLSRAHYPKQFLPLTGAHSLLQETALRFRDDPRFGAPLVICHEEHRFVVAEQLRAVDASPAWLALEPHGRGTAPAAAVAALHVARGDPDALVLVAPADHAVERPQALRDAVARAARHASAGALVTFGIPAATPHTGYGYIQRGEPVGDGVFRVNRFVEKPSADIAALFVASGEYAWNSGMFLFTAGRYLEELGRLRPEMLAACRRAAEAGTRDLDFFRLDAEAFSACEADSIDYAVMEKTAHAVVMPVEVGWSDVGSWDALWRIGAKDAAGNAALGDALVDKSMNCYVRGEKVLVAALGVRDLVIVATQDAVLVADRARAGEVRRIVERLVAAGREEPFVHPLVYRPWGSYEGVKKGPRFQVKHLWVKPGAKISLQYHNRRAEHWVVVGGTARVTRGDAEVRLERDESTYIPVGVAHSLENPGPDPLEVVEVQTGDYLGEDDIVRLEDRYGRADPPAGAKARG